MRVAWYLGGDMNPERYRMLSRFERAALLDALDEWIERQNEAAETAGKPSRQDR